MSDDRKRLVISIGAAVVLHLAVITIAGLTTHDYETPDEFGPITVEISFDKQPVNEPPQPDAEQINAVDAEEAPPVVTDAPEPVPASEPEPQTVPSPEPEIAAVAPAAAPRSYAPASVDNSFLDALKQRSSTGGVDARAVFGDDPVPSSTDTPDVRSASGAQDESSVELIDAEPAQDRVVQPEPVEPSETSVIDAGVLSSLDDRLAAANSSDNKAEKESPAIKSDELTPAAADVSGLSKNIVFNNPALSRELVSWNKPEIPVEVQRAGVSKYTVVIEFDIDSDGITSGAVIKRPSSDTRVDAAVQKSLRNWVFETSSSQAGKKVRATLTYVIEIK